MAGIQETKEALDLAISIANPLGDGFQSTTDLVPLLLALQKFPAAFEGIQQVPTELGDLDDAEVAELGDFVREKFDIPDDMIEETIERGLILAAQLAAFVLFLARGRQG